ncbi:MAG: polysaccharide export protein [Candidatus Omnitrophica bacterium]|nr:polysaccharide export protein [Candidatus Omnitrophota bacterium]
MEMIKNNKILYVLITINLFVAKPVLAQQNLIQTQTSFIEKQEKGLSSPTVDNLNNFDPLTYSLGPEDVVEITVMNHPEFSGKYAINLDGILQYKFVGDIQVKDLTKKELEEKLKSIISAYVINPSINVTVVEYKSKVIYVLGEVKQPGKYYMRSESIPIREAVVQAGLPLQSAAMRKCRIITPDKNGRVKTRSVDLYAVLYGGNLKLNLEMHPGDVLYVPCTIMAKLFRVISPVTSTVSGAAAGPEGAATAKTSAATLAR